MAATSLPPRKRPKKTPLWPFILVGLLIFMAAAVLGSFYASTSLLDKPSTKDDDVEGLLVAKDKATIMIMGVDERADDIGRSDTLMIATIDPKKNKAALLSIPRDTRVRLPRYGFDKINVAYSLGGAKLTETAVEQLIGVNIDHYVIINTKAFTKIIDAIGGIDIVVEERMYYEDPWDDDGGLVIDLQPGAQHMDGKTAVGYVRYRDEEGDIGRVRRQQKFMRACFDAIVSPRVIPRLPAIISEIMSSVRTDLSLRQLLEFVGTLKNAHDNGLRTEMVPGRPLYIDEISYWVPNVGELRRSLAGMLGIKLSENDRRNIERIANEYENSIPAGASEITDGYNSIGSAVNSMGSDDSEDSENEDADRQETDSRRPERDRTGETKSQTTNSSTGSDNTGNDETPAVNTGNNERGRGQGQSTVSETRREEPPRIAIPSTTEPATGSAATGSSSAEPVRGSGNRR